MRERVHELLMLALYRAGRQSDALREYEATRRALGEGLGLEPGPGDSTARAGDPRPGQHSRLGSAPRPRT